MPNTVRIARRLAVVTGLFLVICVVYLEGSMSRVDAQLNYWGRPAPGAGTNWLLVGSDSRQGLGADGTRRLHAPGDVAGQRADTIMLLHIPDNSTRPTLVSLLRDSWVQIPGHEFGKINAAYSQGGGQLLTRTVELNTGLRIEHYAEVGLGGFADVVDDVGGIKVCLQVPLHDPYAHLDLSAGCHMLNGAQGLSYVRSRHAFAHGDWDRTSHQRHFLGALASKMGSPAVLANPMRVLPLVRDLAHSVTVGSGDHVPAMLNLASALHGIAKGSVCTAVVPTAGSSGSALLWDAPKAQRWWRALNHDLAVTDCGSTPLHA